MEFFMNIPSSLKCHGTCCKEFTTKLDGKVDNVAWKEALRWLQWVLDVRSDGRNTTIFFSQTVRNMAMKQEIYLGTIQAAFKFALQRFIYSISPLYPQLKCQDLICQANDDLDAAIKTVRDMVSSLRLDVDARRRKALLSTATVDCKKQSRTKFVYISPYIC